MNKLHVLYVPGLGDHDLTKQSNMLVFWKWWNVETEIFQMNWADDVAWKKKFNALLKRIDGLYAKGEKIALVGISAGGSAVINAYAARPNKIVGVACIAGKINQPEKIGPRYHNRNPSFVESAKNSPLSVDKLTEAQRSKILSRYGVFDPLVSKTDSRVPGARNRLSPTIGHVMTIAYQITIGAPSLLHFLKKQMKDQTKA